MCPERLQERLQEASALPLRLGFSSAADSRSLVLSVRLLRAAEAEVGAKTSHQTHDLVSTIMSVGGDKVDKQQRSTAERRLGELYIKP